MTDIEAVTWIKQHATDHINAFTTKAELAEAEEAQFIAIQAILSRADHSNVVGNYAKGFNNGLRLSNYRVHNMRKEILEDSQHRRDSLFEDGMRYCLEIIDKYFPE